MTGRAPLWSFGRSASLIYSAGGLKGKTALGDAHPYLALFYLYKGVKLKNKRKTPLYCTAGHMLARRVQRHVPAAQLVNECLHSILEILCFF